MTSSPIQHARTDWAAPPLGRAEEAQAPPSGLLLLSVPKFHASRTPSPSAVLSPRPIHSIKAPNGQGAFIFAPISDHFSNSLNNSEITPARYSQLVVGQRYLGGFRCAPCLESPWQRPPSALLHLAAQLMQAMVPPLVQGCWGLASEPWSAVRSHRKRCMSLRRRRSITRRLHLFTSRRLSTSRPSTLDRGITVVHIEVIGASATFGFPFKDAILPGPQKKFPVRRLGNSTSSLLWF